MSSYRRTVEMFSRQASTGGFVNGASDTAQQAAIRAQLKANRPTGQAKAKDDEVEAEPEIDVARMEALKRETARRVAEYQRQRGMP